MRRAGFAFIRLAPLLAVLLGPSCYSLPKVEVIRVIDDFAGPAPTWDVFEPWTCGPHVDRSQTGQGGQDAGQDGGPPGNVDAGQVVSCTLAMRTDETDPAIPPDTVTHTLVASFDLTTQSSVEIVTRTRPQATDNSVDAMAFPMTVNLTGFSHLLFHAKLVSTTPGTAQLPTGTELHVELHCSATHDTLDQDVTLSPEVATWKAIDLPFSGFLGASRESCFGTVDSIAFVVVPGIALAGTEVRGTLQLDNIRLQ